MMNFSMRRFLCAAVLLSLVTVGVSGCGKSREAPRPTPTSAADSDRSELFTSFARNLNQLEESQNQQVLMQTRDWLNSWMSDQQKVAARNADSLVKTLPAPLRKDLDGDTRRAQFDLADAEYMQEAIWLRDASRTAAKGEIDALPLAEKLFDWTIRNIQLEAAPSGESERRLTPGEILLLGRGTAEERGWIFILLARQQRLDAVMLAIGDDPKTQRIWLPAVLISGKLYLFDTTLGLPIRSRDGTSLATLGEVMADEALLKNFDLDAEHRYRVSPGDLKNVVALVESSPRSLSARMKAVEARLAGSQRVVLTSSASGLADRLKQARPAVRVQFWSLPHEVSARRKTLGPESDKSVRLELSLMRPDSSLWHARVRHIKGKYDGPEGAKKHYMTVRYSKSQLASMRDKPEALLGPILVENMHPERRNELIEQYTQALESPDDRRMVRENPGRFLGPLVVQGLKPEDRDRLAKQAIAAFSITKQYATYWLGTTALEQGDYASAIDYLGKRTLEASPDGPRHASARYNLARAYEATGDVGRAIELYQADTSPQSDGNKLRARWLEEVQAERQPADDKQAK